MAYINPIPYMDAGKEFELRLKVSFDEATELKTAKKNAAEYIKDLPMEDLEKHLACLNTEAIYPTDNREPEKEREGMPINTYQSLFLDTEVIINNAFLAKGLKRSLEHSELRRFCDILYKKASGDNRIGVRYMYIMFQAKEEDIDKFCENSTIYARELGRIICKEDVTEEQVEEVNRAYGNTTQTLLKEAREEFAGNVKAISVEKQHFFDIETPQGKIRAIESPDSNNPGIILLFLDKEGKEHSSCIMNYLEQYGRILLDVYFKDPIGDPVYSFWMSH